MVEALVMELAVFGATGHVGREVVKQALAVGHRVRAYVRPASQHALPPAEGLRPHVGELHDAAAVSACVAGADAVISALGARVNRPDQPPLFEEALTNIVRAMETTGPRRLVSISGAATALPGDPPNLGGFIVRGVMRLVAGHVLKAKEREAEVIRHSALDWTLVRPPRIVPGEADGGARVSEAKPPSTKITRGEVARFMLEGIPSETWVRKAPFVSA